MKEKILQSKLLKLIENGKFYESIKKKDELYKLIIFDKETNMFPEFPIDKLLRKKYTISASNVIKSLTFCELVSGKIIKNISLENKDRLYPDCILYNKETEQVILIENKTNKKTERETITELLGYSQEIFNHLPFLSNCELNYVVISTEFSTLLDHATASMVLLNNQNLLCLKPIDTDDELTFEVHYPNSWTEIGQDYLPKNSFGSYTLCLYNKENVSEKINKRSLLAIAKDLILTEATNSKTHGFMIIWQDGINFADHDYAISIYLLNPFVFIPRALENDFILNEESELFKFIYNYISEEGIDKIPSSVYKIGRRAKEYLSKYYNPDWEMASTWELDLFEDELYKFQRLPIIFDSWGLIGEFVREYYLSNAAQQGYFTPKELITNPYGYLQPLAGLQIINNLCGISLFTNGHYLVSDIFRFGKQICQYLYVCHNCLNTTEDKEISNNASLFWNNLLIINSIREIQLRLFDIKKSFESPPKFTLYHSKFAIPEDYKAKILEFNSWFSKNFIGNHEVHRIIFQFACNYGLYFNELYRKVLSKKDEIVVQDEIGSFVKHVLKDVISRIKNNGLALNEEGVSNLEYMLGNISNQDEEELIGRINKLSNIFFISVFEEYILKILDNVFGEIIHELSQFNFSNSVDWNWIASKTKENFHKKMRYTVFEITPNNRMILRQLSDEEVLALPKLTSEEEIYVKFYPYSGRSMILKEKLENLVSGKFFKKVFE